MVYMSVPLQLDDSEKARSWLQEAVGNASHLNASETEARYKKMEKELKKMKSAEKARVRVYYYICAWFTCPVSLSPCERIIIYTAHVHYSSS